MKLTGYYGCNGYEVYVADYCTDSELKAVKAVCEKIQRFRYREVTLQDWRKHCWCCQHAKVTFGCDDDGGDIQSDYCGFFSREVSEADRQTVYGSGITNIIEYSGTCDAYVAEDDVIKALEVYRNREKHKDDVVRRAVDVLWTYDRRFRY